MTRRVVLLGAGVVLLWLVFAGYLAYGAYGDLQSARTSLEQLGELSLDSDSVQAEDGFQSAAESFARADRRLSGMGAAPLRILPLLGDDVRVLSRLASAGASAAQAGAGLLDAVNELPNGIASLAPTRGGLPTAHYEALEEPLRRANVLLAFAARQVQQTQWASLTAEVAQARSAMAEQLPGAAAAVRRAAAIGDALPEFLGDSERQRYLFLAQNPAEARGTGGFIGAFSILTLDEGRPSFQSFDEIQSLPAYHATEVIAPSGEYARRYNRYGGAGFWHNINMTPDFPTAARAMLTLYEKGTGTRLDGVIATDPFALEALLEASGPVEVPGFGTVAADEVVDVVSNRAHAEIKDSDRRKRLLGAVSVAAFASVMGGRGDSTAGFRALAEAADQGHIKLRSTDPDVQAAFVRAGIAGAVPDPPGDFLSVVANAGSAAKLDYYIKRSIDYDVELHRDGSAAATMTLTLDNDAPDSGISHRVIGPNVDGLEAGEQRLILSTYTADGARLGMRSGNRRPVRTEVELGHQVFTTVTTVGAGETRRLLLAWERSAGWNRRDWRYQLTVHPQTTLRPTDLTVRVRPPDGTRFAGGPEGATTAADGTLRWIGQLEAPVALDLRLVAAD